MSLTRRKFQTLLDFTLPAHALTDQAPIRGRLLTPEGPSLPRGAWSLLSHRTGGAALRRRSSSEEASSEEEEEEEEEAAAVVTEASPTTEAVAVAAPSPKDDGGWRWPFLKR